MTYTYRDLYFYEWMLSELKKQPGSKLEHIKARIIEMKRQIRANNKHDNEGKVVQDNGIDGCIIKLPLPECIKTLEEADEYFTEFEFIRYRPTYYDCTGQSFTAWYKIFQKPDGRFWAYHHIARDV